MGLLQTTAPTVEPVTLAEAKSQLNLSTSAHDVKIGNDAVGTGLIAAARAHVEGLTHRQLNTATWDWYLPCFPGVGGFMVPWPILQTVGYIKYLDVAGDLQTLSTDVYQLDIYSQPGRIVLKHSQSWPSLRDDINAVQIRFVAGYGDAASDVPIALRQLILRLVAHLFEFPGVVDSMGKVTDTPAGFEGMLSLFVLPDVTDGSDV